MNDRYTMDQKEHIIRIYDGTELIGRLPHTSLANAIWELKCKRVREMIQLANLGAILNNVPCTPIKMPPTMTYHPTECRSCFIPIVFFNAEREKRRRGIININDIVGAIEYSQAPEGEAVTQVSIRGNEDAILVLGSPEQFLPQLLGQDIELNHMKEERMRKPQEKMV